MRIGYGLELDSFAALCVCWLRGLCWAFFLVDEVVCIVIYELVAVFSFKWKTWKSGSSWRSVVDHRRRYIEIKAIQHNIAGGWNVTYICAAAWVGGHIGFTMFVVPWINGVD